MDTPLPGSGPLLGDVKTEVCVIGGGIAGLLIAERLANQGIDVVLLESDLLASGETGHTTAHFTSALDDRYTELERLHGEKGARLAAHSHTVAIDYIEELINRLGVDCGWSRLDGYLTVNEQHRERARGLLQEELAAALRAGVEVYHAELLPAPWPSAGAAGALSAGPALRFPRQGQADPIRLLRAVAKRLLATGVRLHSKTRATAVHAGADGHVETDRGPVVRCQQVVVATNTPVINRVAVHTKQAGYQTYVVAFRIPAGALPPLLWWDGLWENDTSYHYVRLAHGAGSIDGDDLLIVGGEDHKTGQGGRDDEPYQRLEEWARRHFLMCGSVVRRWSGEVMEPADGLAYIGRNAGLHHGPWIVTGDSGNGMTHAAIAAMLIPDLIMGHENPWAALYDPARKVGLHALSDFVGENLNTLAQYRDWLASGDARDEDEIPRGEGAIVVNGLTRLAVYKDPEGRCTRLSPMCTHLGGVVRWNAQEKTWDCPCHASRFDRYGKVLHGPANADLSVAKEASEPNQMRSVSDPMVASAHLTP